jgi:hypothetical protein
MADEIDNRLIAAHLAAALIAKHPSNGLPVVETVKLFNDVLGELAKSVELAPPSIDAAEQPELRFYESSNGDTWSLVRHPSTGEQVVMHQPNATSGGQRSYIDVERFLLEEPTGPQNAALRKVIRLRASEA